MVSSQAGRPAGQRHQIVHGEIGAMQVHARIMTVFFVRICINFAGRSSLIRLE